MFVLASTVEQQVLGPNVRRKRVEFRNAGSTQVIYIRTDSLGASNGGISIIGNAGPLILDAEVHGDIVKGPFFAMSVTGTQNLSVVETIY